MTSSNTGVPPIEFAVKLRMRSPLSCLGNETLIQNLNVIEMRGVIRDVSRDAVGNEILALGRNNRSCNTVEV
jgi:hypothetical protein